MHETITKGMKSKQIVILIPTWATSITLPVVNNFLEVTVTEEKEWSYTREEETVSVHREEEYEEYEEYDYKEFEEYEPAEEYDQYEDYEERELEHYEESKEYITGMNKTANLNHIKYMQIPLEQDTMLGAQRNWKELCFLWQLQDVCFLG